MPEPSLETGLPMKGRSAAPIIFTLGMYLNIRDIYLHTGLGTAQHPAGR